MQEVQFFTYEGEEPTESGVATFDGELVTFMGVAPGMVEMFNTVGVRVGSKVFFPKDGLEFMGALKHAYSGSRFRATGIREV